MKQHKYVVDKNLTVFLLSVKAACWSPDGKVLVFAVANEPALYSLQFQDQIGEHIEQQIADVSTDKTAQVPLYQPNIKTSPS